MSLQIIVALIGLAGVLIGTLVTYLVTKNQADSQVAIARESAANQVAIARENATNQVAIARENAAGQVAIARESAATERLVADEKLQTENRLEIASYQAIRKLLQQTDWQMRSFGAIKHHLRGFLDDELRKLLVAAGAVAFTSEEGDELWGLLSRNEGRLKPLRPSGSGGGTSPGNPQLRNLKYITNPTTEI
jgi:hypothetical protein